MSDTTKVSEDSRNAIPLACNLNAEEFQVRGDENAVLFAHARTVEELPDGYRFAFPPEAERVSSLLEFILAERDCCPFFTFELQFTPPHAEVWLSIRGGEEIKGIVHDMLMSKAEA